jgi:predicted transcriptional regulator
MSPDITYDDENVVREFYAKIEQIAVKWIYVWSMLSKYEKQILTTLIENGSLKWNELLTKVNFSDGTLIKNLAKLKNKGIIYHLGNEYRVEDQMLSSWLKYMKERDGFYPQ